MHTLLYAAFSFLILLSASCNAGIINTTGSSESADSLRLTLPSSKPISLDSHSITSFFNTHKKYKSYEKEVRQFYALRNYSHAWFSDGGLSEQAAHFVNMYKNYSYLLRDNSLNEADIDSFVDLFRGDKTNFLKNKDHIDETELHLTAHFYYFSQKTYEGRVPRPQELEWYIPRQKLDMSALLETMTSKKQANTAFKEPVSRYFQMLKQQLITYYELEKSDTLGPIQMKERKLKLGDSSATIARIRAKMQLWGDLKAKSKSYVFDLELENAVKKFQSKRGLAPDGTIGQQTLQAINVSMAQVTKQILINLERMRWIPVEQNGDFLVVNIPEFKLHIFEDGKYLQSTEVIVGKSISNTVIFSHVIEFVVFAPYWNVPSHIQHHEIEPEIRKNRHYLANKMMERLPNGSIRQKPGPFNSLGQVKFLFPNSYNIYLHDTPIKNLFDEPKRNFSHGCIRVNRPAEIASFLLKDQAEWTRDAIDSAMNASKEKYVKVQRPVKIFITYFTAWIDKEGNLQLRDDIYGHDKKLEKLLFEHGS